MPPTNPQPPNTDTEQTLIRTSSFRTHDIEAQKDDQAYVRNSSFLSRDIEAKKANNSPVRYPSPPKDDSINSNKCLSPPMEVISLTKKLDKINSPPKASQSLPIKKEILSPPKKDVPSPPVRNLSRISSFQKQNSSFDSNKDLNSPTAVESTVLNKNSLQSSNLQYKVVTSPSATNKVVTSPPVNNKVVMSPFVNNKGVISPPINNKGVNPPLIKGFTSPPVNNTGVTSPPINNKGVTSPSVVKGVTSPNYHRGVASPPYNKGVTSPLVNKGTTSPPVNKGVTSPPVNKGVTSPPVNNKVTNSSPVINKGITSPPVSNKEMNSPLVNSFKFNKIDPKPENAATDKKGQIMTKETPVKTDKLSLPANNEVTNNLDQDTHFVDNEKGECQDIEKGEETNGVGDKIRKFEKAAEDAGASGRLSRPGSVRGRTRTDRIGSDSKEDLPPPATPFKDHVFFDNGTSEKSASEPNQKSVTLERQNSINKTSSLASKWQRNDSSSIEDKVQKPEPQKIIKPEFKPMPSPVDLTIRSPSLGTKLPDQFPSQGTAFRNVASPDPARSNTHKFNEDNVKVCKLKNKEKYSVSKGSSYFTRGSEEIWLVKKKDIEEIEERVLDSFRRAGGNICLRSESMRPSSDSGQSVSFPHATMGRNKRPMYTRSESLDPQWAGARAQTLKRQSSVACTCGHDKKARSKSAAADTPRLRSRSHGDENNQGHVLDKYETLV